MATPNLSSDFEELARLRRRVAELERRAVQSDLVGVLDCRGDRIVEASPSFLDWLGFSPQESGLDWRALTPASFRARDDEAVRELRMAGFFGSYEKAFLSRSGQAIPVRVSGRGSPEAFVLVAVNLTENAALETRLLRAQKLESLGLIGGGVAHDLNNLLATIMGNASMSSEALPCDHIANRTIAEIVLASRRASELTQQMLAYCGRAKVRIEPMDLSAMVREIGSLLKTTISKKIALSFDLAAGLPSIKADPGQIQQVVMNLVINASDAIGEQAGMIAVTTGSTRGSDSEHFVFFEVADTGCGMTEEVKSRVFDPFFTTKAEGRGLGLSAVREIVRSHRGSLRVDSEPGSGTAFRVMFPADNASVRVPEATARGADFRGTETVLIADDDESIRRMTGTALERLGYKVLVATNGEEAVELFQRHRAEIAVVLLDWAMPVMNGDEALRSILVVDPAAHVVMSSGYAEPGLMTQRSASADFIQKPYTMAQLAQKLRAAIDRRQDFPIQ